MNASTRPRRRRFWWIAGAAIALLAVAAAAAPVVTGLQARARLEAVTDRVSARVDTLAWRVTSFDRGAYSSHAESRLEWRFPDSDREPVGLRLRHRIEHGPRLGGWYLARVETVPVLSDTALERIGAAYGERDPITAVFVRRLDGAREVALRSPPVDVRAADGPISRWRSQGLDLAMRWDGARLRIDGGAPGLELASGWGRAGLDDLRVTGDLERRRGVWTGRLEVALASVSAQLRGAGGGGAGFRLEDLRLRQGAQRDGAALTGAFDLRAASLEVPGARYRKLHGRMAAEGIPAELVQRLNRAVRRAQAQGREPLAAMASVLQAYGPAKTVAHQPAVVLEALTVETPRGPVRVDGRLDLGQGDGPAPRGWLQLLSRLQARTRLDLPRAVALDLAEAYYRRQMPPADEGGPSDAEVERLVQRRAEGLVERGWLERHEGQLRTEIAYDGGVIRINGRPAWNVASLLGG